MLRETVGMAQGRTARIDRVERRRMSGSDRSRPEQPDEVGSFDPAISTSATLSVERQTFKGPDRKPSRPLGGPHDRRPAALNSPDRRQNTCRYRSIDR
jgi:hypothetical protein